VRCWLGALLLFARGRDSTSKKTSKKTSRKESKQARRSGGLVVTHYVFRDLLSRPNLLLSCANISAP